MFIGNLGNKSLIAGIGMGIMITNMVVRSVTWGLNSALETLVSQAYGAQ